MTTYYTLWINEAQTEPMSLRALATIFQNKEVPEGTPIYDSETKTWTDWSALSAAKRDVIPGEAEDEQPMAAPVKLVDDHKPITVVELRSRTQYNLVRSLLTTLLFFMALAAFAGWTGFAICANGNVEATTTAGWLGFAVLTTISLLPMAAIVMVSQSILDIADCALRKK